MQNKLNIGVRASYPESGNVNWEEFLLSNKIPYIELAFYNPENFKKISIDDVVAPIIEHPIGVLSIHMAHAKITKEKEFIQILGKTIEIARQLLVDVIVIHPSKSKSKPDNIYKFIEKEVDPIIEHYGIIICWETFTSKYRFFSGPEQIADFCISHKNHKMCYDFSHMHKDTNQVLKDIDKYFSFIRIFHVSNWAEGKQHIPIYTPEGNIDFRIVFKELRDRNFKGHLILEYLPEFHDQLYEDYNRISS